MRDGEKYTQGKDREKETEEKKLTEERGRRPKMERARQER
jgi:hypothetical protein